MHRTDAAGNESNLFVDYNATLGKPGTTVDAAWLNAVQEELCNALEGLGITLAKGTNTQVRDLLKASCQSVMSFGTPLLSPNAGQTKFFVPGFGDLLTDSCALRAPVAGVLRNLRVNAGTASTGATAFDKITVMVNGVDTSITCSLSPGETSDSDTAHSATVSAGDLIEVKVTRSGAGIAVPAANVVVALALTMG